MPTNNSFHTLEFIEYSNMSIDDLREQVRNEEETSFVGSVISTGFFIASEVVANFLLFCMIQYEIYGMDPQKRSVSNRLLSSICMATIIFHICFLPIIVLQRIWNVGLPSFLTIWIYIGYVTFPEFVVITACEMLIIKWLYLKAFSRVAQVEDSFLSAIIITFNCLIFILIIAIRLILGEYITSPFYMDGNTTKMTFDVHVSIRFWTGQGLMTASLGLGVVLLIAIGFQKFKMSRLILGIPKSGLNHIKVEESTVSPTPEENSPHGGNATIEQSQGDDETDQENHPKVIVVKECPTKSIINDQENDENSTQEEIPEESNPEVIEESPPEIVDSEENEPKNGIPSPVPDWQKIFNNTAKNEELLNNLGIVILALFFSCISLIIVVNVKYGLGVQDVILIAYCTIVTLCPALFFLKRKRGLAIILQDMGFNVNFE